MLDDDASGAVKTAHAFPGCIGIGDIVIGQFLALQLLVTAKQAGAYRLVYVEGCRLVWIFAITQGLFLLHLHGQRARPLAAFWRLVLGGLCNRQAAKVGRDGAVVGSRM